MTEETKEERVHHVFEKIYNKYDSMNSVIHSEDIFPGEKMS